MTPIGIIGAGVAGLHVGLHLLKHGVSATIYADRTPDELRASRLPNTVALMGKTRERDRELGVNHWDAPDFGTFCLHLRVAGDPPLEFRGDFSPPAMFIDMRMYLARLLEDFAERGGQVVRAAPTAAELAGLSARHELVVVATGRAGITSVFPRLDDRSPYTEPQRRLFAGLFRGVGFRESMGMGFNIVPGHGEIIESPFLSQTGPVHCLLVEAIPGGALEPITRMRHDDDPGAFNAAALEVLRSYAPRMYERADPAAFALTAPLDHLQGAVTPAVRRGHAVLDGGRPAIAIGDAHIAHDPITGQGANAAARTALLLGEALVARLRAGLPLDAAFCAETSDRLLEQERPVTEWTNAFLQPPPPHVMDLLVAAARDKAVADAFVANFNDPPTQWAVVSSPEATAAFIARRGAPLG